MLSRAMKPIFAASVLLAAIAAGAIDDRSALADHVVRLTRDSQWKHVASVRMNFRTFHPQGMVKIGSTLFVSSVEVRARTKMFPQPVDGFDRDAGEGAGHLFKIDLSGNLITDLKLGDGTVYHPGGLDYDGRNIWVPVAEYRPNSRAIIYRVDPATMQATEVLRVADHVGAVALDTDNRSLHGVSWGSRRFYRWSVGPDLRMTNGSDRPKTAPTLNTSHYVDYQDCKYVPKQKMLCTGVSELRRAPDAAPFRLGGMELVDLATGRPLHQVPVLLWTSDGLDMTHNAVWIEPTATGLRGYFMPEDDASTLYVYDVDTRPGR